MSVRLIAAIASLGLALSASVARSQDTSRVVPPRGGDVRPQAAGSPPAQRIGLERQVQQALFRAVRLRVGLTDEQMRRLVAADRKFEVRRRDIMRMEHDARVALRTQVLDTVSPDQGKIAGYLDQLLKLQRQRIDLVADEQHELSDFMTPLQRAKYMALQEQVRRRVEQMRRPRAVPLATVPDSVAKRPR